MSNKCHYVETNATYIKAGFIYHDFLQLNSTKVYKHQPFLILFKCLISQLSPIIRAIRLILCKTHEGIAPKVLEQYQMYGPRTQVIIST